MVELKQLVRWCDARLNVNAFADYCPNGLQVEGKPEVEKIITAVTASQQAIDAAIAAQAQVLLVHHGYFWKGEAQALTGMKGKRIKALMQHDISLLAYHLPLDAHPQLGNNRALADWLGIEITAPLDPADSIPIGHVGRLPQPLSIAQFGSLISQQLGRPAQHLPGGPPLIQTIGFCTGGAQDYLYKAAALGCDAYLSGEVSERNFHEAKELGIHYFACGHHATERGGVQRLGEELTRQFAVRVEYIDYDNPV